MFKDISLERQTGIYRVTFNRPKVLNAVSNRMTIEMLDALDQIKKTGDCRALVLTGTGMSFTVGADTDAAVQLDNEDYQNYLNRYVEMLKEIENFSPPVIGMINGYAYGGGAEIACACDIRIGSDQASFRFPGASYGLVVSAATLSTIVSLPKAKELMFASEIVDADEAYRIGLLNQVVKAHELEAATNEYIGRILKNNKEPVEQVKKVLNDVVGKTRTERRSLENTANSELRSNTEQRKTFASFTDKRKRARDW